MQSHAIASSEILFKPGNLVCLRLQIEEMFLHAIRTKNRSEDRGKKRTASSARLAFASSRILFSSFRRSSSFSLLLRPERGVLPPAWKR